MSKPFDIELFLLLANVVQHDRTSRVHVNCAGGSLGLACSLLLDHYMWWSHIDKLTISKAEQKKVIEHFASVENLTAIELAGILRRAGITLDEDPTSEQRQKVPTASTHTSQPPAPANRPRRKTIQIVKSSLKKSLFVGASCCISNSVPLPFVFCFGTHNITGYTELIPREN